MLKWLLVVAVATVVIALCTPWLRKRGLGRLPGDVTVRWRGRRVLIPIATTIVLSAVLTLVARLI